MLKEEIRGISSDNAVSDNVFDIVLCSMMLMDCEDFEGTVKEIVRVLKPERRLFASVLHPCFDLVWNWLK